MGYHIYVEVDTGAGNSVDAFHTNYTRNVSPMWTKALGKHISELDQVPADDAVEDLERAVDAMERKRPVYEAMNPENGWGDYEGALEVLRELRDACRAHPRGRIVING